MNMLSTYELASFAGMAAAAPGLRIAKCAFKTDKKSGVKKDTLGTYLPVVTHSAIAASVDVLSAAIKVWIEEAQDAMLRECIVDADLKAGAQLSATHFDMDAIAEWMQQQQVSGRLSAESVGAWFTDAMEEKLTVVLVAKLGIDLENVDATKQDALLKTLEVYKKKIVSLSSGRTSYGKEEANMLLRAFIVCELCKEDGSECVDEVCQKLVTRLQVMARAENAVELLAL